MCSIGPLGLLLASAAAGACSRAPDPVAASRMRVTLDTDANSEFDDEHAIAHLLLNGDVFDADGITVNATRGGGDVAEHAAEAERLVRLSGLAGRIPVYRGANGRFEDIRRDVHEVRFRARSSYGSASSATRSSKTSSRRGATTR